MMPTSMNISDTLQGSVEAAYGGSAIVWQSIYKGLCVAVKVVRMDLPSDIDNILSVSLLLTSSNSCV